MLKEIVSRIHGAAVLVVVTHRPEWTADWATGLAQLTTLAIGRLTKQQMRELIESMLAHIPDQLAEQIAERTDGVPLFVEELTRSILESGKAASLNVEIPDSLQGSLMARLDRLTPAAKEVAQIASVIGREFDRGLLSKVAGLDDRTSTKHCISSCPPSSSSSAAWCGTRSFSAMRSSRIRRTNRS